MKFFVTYRWGTSSNTNETIYKRRIGTNLTTQSPLSPNSTDNNVTSGGNSNNSKSNENSNSSFNSEDVLLSPLSQTSELQLSLLKNSEQRR